jgi:hypothetical protein
MTKYIRNQTKVKPYRVQVGLLPNKSGRPKHTGFTPSDVVSAVLELKLRELGHATGSMAEAVRYVKSVFVDLSGDDVERTIYSDWKKGKNLAKGLDTEDLLKIVEPYKLE